jgi:hypothetical protein
MQISDDIIEPLVGEILNDVANSFFDARRTLEAKIDLFHKFVNDLKELSADVQCRASLLNLLLINDQHAQAFYRLIGIDGAVFLTARESDPRNCLSEIPFGIGPKNRYTKLVFAVYGNLQEACNTYLNGRQSSDKSSAHPNHDNIYYQLILKMHQVLNDDIKRINETVSPSCTLQFAKQFDQAKMAKEKVTGGGISNPQLLDNKLCYRPINMDNLGLSVFPLLPDLGDVKASVRGFCKDIYIRYPNELKNIIEFVKNRITA